jgi:hypothetical protein
MGFAGLRAGPSETTLRDDLLEGGMPVCKEDGMEIHESKIIDWTRDIFTGFEG